MRHILRLNTPIPHSPTSPPHSLGPDHVTSGCCFCSAFAARPTMSGHRRTPPALRHRNSPNGNTLNGIVFKCNVKSHVIRGGHSGLSVSILSAVQLLRCFFFYSVQCRKQTFCSGWYESMRERGSSHQHEVLYYSAGDGKNRCKIQRTFFDCTHI